MEPVQERRNMPDQVEKDRPQRRGIFYGTVLTLWIVIAFSLGLFTILSLAFRGSLSASEDAEEAQEPVLLDMAMTTASLGPVHPVEAVAAFETYANAYASALGVPVLVKVTVFDSLAEMSRSLQQGREKITGLQTEDYLRLREDVALDVVFAPEMSGEISERYLLLVHVDSGLEELAHLRGKDLLAHIGTRMGMADTWLEGLLLGAHFPESRSFFRGVRRRAKLSSVVLPVFFRQADACLVAQSGFDTMRELNPQVGQLLRAIASSPAVVPFVTCIRSDFTGPNRRRTETAYLEAHLHPAGQQTLMLFGFDRMRRCTERDLESAREMMRRYHQRRRDAHSGNERGPSGN